MSFCGAIAWCLCNVCAERREVFDLSFALSTIANLRITLTQARTRRIRNKNRCARARSNLSREQTRLCSSSLLHILIYVYTRGSLYGWS